MNKGALLSLIAGVATEGFLGYPTLLGVLVVLDILNILGILDTITILDALDYQDYPVILAINSTQFKTLINSKHVILSLPLLRTVRHFGSPHLGIHLVQVVVGLDIVVGYISMVRREVYQIPQKKANNRGATRR